MLEPLAPPDHLLFANRNAIILLTKLTEILNSQRKKKKKKRGEREIREFRDQTHFV